MWRHEITRVIFDRLINEEDHDHVNTHLVALLEANYPDKMEYIMRDPILYADYTNTLEPAEPRLYECIEDLPTAQVCVVVSVVVVVVVGIFFFLSFALHAQPVDCLVTSEM